jgi:hypothetical protein
VEPCPDDVEQAAAVIVVGGRLEELPKTVQQQPPSGEPHHGYPPEAEGFQPLLSFDRSRARSCALMATMTVESDPPRKVASLVQANPPEKQWYSG